MVAVDLNPEVEGTVVPEITIAAGKSKQIHQVNWKSGKSGCLVTVCELLKNLVLVFFHSRSQGSYGDRPSGGSYRDSYDSYGKS